jgi:hypothetical protein
VTKEEALKILGIKSAHPSEKDLKSAYRYKQFILHPDRLPPNASDEMRQRASDELKLVNEAYSIILNLLNGTEEEIRPPRLHVAPRSIRFKDMAYGQIKSTTLEIKSVGGPYTKVWIECLPMPWLNIAPRTSLSNIHLPAQIRIEALSIQQGDPRSSCHLKVKMINESTGQLDEVKVNIERLSQAQTPTPKPRPVVTPTYIRFDNVTPNETKTSSFTIENAGGPYSKLGFTRPNSWLKVARWSSLSTSDELPLKVEIEGVGTDWDKTYTESITVNLDQEETTVKVELITKPFSNNKTDSHPGAFSQSAASNIGSGRSHKGAFPTWAKWLVGMLAIFLIVMIVSENTYNITQFLLSHGLQPPWYDQLAVLPAPGNVQAVATDSSHIRVTWTDNSGGQTSFNISDTQALNATVNPGTTSYTFGDVAPGSSHCFHIQAVNSAGSSDWTDYACTMTPLSTLPPTAPLPIGNQGRIAFVSNRDGNNQIYVMNADGSNQTSLTSIPASGENPAWSPDGNKIAYDSGPNSQWQIYVMNADGSNQTRLTQSTAENIWSQRPAWSPDGSKIAFQSDRDGNCKIFVMNADGSNQTRLTSGNWDDREPSWSSDGKKIVFASRGDGLNLRQIYAMNADGSSPRRLTNNAFWGDWPAWSPDGSKIAFSTYTEKFHGIYVIDADGSNQIKLTDIFAWYGPPSWSPDGKKIVFDSNRDGNNQIYVMNADGSNLTRLTVNSFEAYFPFWLHR